MDWFSLLMVVLILAGLVASLAAVLDVVNVIVSLVAGVLFVTKKRMSRSK